MLKLEDNPPSLPTGIGRPSEIPGEWHVAHTKSRVEKSLAWDLLAKKIPFYMPLLKRVRMSGGRRRTTLIPLFPSYVFFAGPPEAKLAAMQTGRIVHVIPIPRQAPFVAELDAVHAALETGLELDIYPHVAVGRRVRVTRGPMRGVEGIVVHGQDVARIVLTVSVIGGGASLQIAASDLEESV